MPRDVQGNTSPLPGTLVNTGDTILPSQHNPMVNDVYAMMAQSLSRDGQGGMRAPLNMSGFRIENVGTAVSDTDAVSLGQSRSSGVPLGVILDYAGSATPDKWLQCYGQQISRTTYADLFSIIGTTYGVGDGSTTFNLPDLRGRVAAGRDDMGGTPSTRLSAFFGFLAITLGGVFGSASRTLDVSNMPAHNHGGVTSVNGSHTHQTSGFMATGGATSVAVWGNGNRTDSSNQTLAAGDHQHSIPSQGSGVEFGITQPTIIMNKIIKVSY